MNEIAAVEVAEDELLDISRKCGDHSVGWFIGGLSKVKVSDSDGQPIF